jgi:hypothetical protein
MLLKFLRSMKSDVTTSAIKKKIKNAKSHTFGNFLAVHDNLDKSPVNDNT